MNLPNSVGFLQLSDRPLRAEGEMANRRNIIDRLKDGDVLLMDGGTGSEIQRRGVDVLRGATADKLMAWSATANVTDADVVQQVHQDYLRVGADIIISNNFWTIPSAMDLIGLRDHWKEYAAAAADNAVTARANGNPYAYIAGGIAAPTLDARTDVTGSDVEQMGAEVLHEEFAEPAKLVAEAGVDVILPEYVGYLDDCVAAVDACADAGKPVFLGVRHVQPNGRMQYDESLEDLAAALKGHPVDVVLLMCTDPESATAGLPILRDAHDGPVGVYPNIGYNPTGPIAATPQPDKEGPDFLLTAPYPPSRMADFAGVWKEMGAQIIGGCCASGPEHIMAMRPVVKGD